MLQCAQWPNHALAIIMGNARDTLLPAWGLNKETIECGSIKSTVADAADHHTMFDQFIHFDI